MIPYIESSLPNVQGYGWSAGEDVDAARKVFMWDVVRHQSSIAVTYKPNCSFSPERVSASQF